MWFLAGTFGASPPVTRRCTIPVGKALFFPIVNGVFIVTEPTETEALAHREVKNFIDAVETSLLAGEVDGKRIRNPGSYRAHSPTFPVTLPEDNVFGAPAGTFPLSAADGFYLMLHPLRPGKHTVHIHGVFPDGAALDVTYHLVVGPGRH